MYTKLHKEHDLMKILTVVLRDSGLRQLRGSLYREFKSERRFG